MIIICIDFDYLFDNSFLRGGENLSLPIACFPPSSSLSLSFFVGYILLTHNEIKRKF